MQDGATSPLGGPGRLAFWLRQVARILNLIDPPRPVLPRAAAPPRVRLEPDADTTPPAPTQPSVPTVAAPMKRLASLSDPRRQAVNDSFNSTQPVVSRHDLYGRGDTLDALFEATITRHQHALIYGARGSGKTSLVRVFADFADQQGMVLIYTACAPDQSFGALMRLYLDIVPAESLPPRQLHGFRAAAAKLDDTTRARDVVEALSSVRGKRIVFILDEYDRVTDPAVRAEIAMLLKLLSDAGVPVQLILVGIAGDLRDLIADHPSLRRHLSAFPIGRIDERAVTEMIDRGAGRAGFTFDDASKRLIVDLACGSPYHARLFCAHAALSALRSGETAVTSPATLAGIVAAAEDWATLSEDDAALFRTLAACDPAVSGDLAKIAQIAAIEDIVSIDRLRRDLGDRADDRVARLGTALIRHGHNQLVFRDSVAPQFFLAMLATRAAGADPCAAPVTPHAAPSFAQS